MSRTARINLFFGLYIIAIGAWLLIGPGSFTDVLRLPAGEALYLRVLGVIVAVLGYYYVTAALDENLAFIRKSLLGRTAAATGLVVVGLTGGEPMIAAFAIPDYATALLTIWSLRQEPAESDAGTS